MAIHIELIRSSERFIVFLPQITSAAIYIELLRCTWCVLLLTLKHYLVF